MTASPIGSEGYYSYDRIPASTEYRTFDYTWIQAPVPGTFTVTLRDPEYAVPNRGPLRSPDYTWAFRNARALATVIVKPQNRQTDWPNPTPIPRLPDYTWIQRSLVLPKPTPFVPVDQPNPKSISWYRSLEVSGNALTAVPTPFIPRDQSLSPVGPQRLQDYTWIQRFNLTNPINQYDWPNPKSSYWYRDWNQNLVLTTLSTVQNPFRQSDWPVPQQVIQPIQTWSFFSESLVNQPNPQPFAQSDWPNPQPTMWYRDWNNNLLETTLFQVFKPFNQS